MHARGSAHGCPRSSERSARRTSRKSRECARPKRSARVTLILISVSRTKIARTVFTEQNKDKPAGDGPAADASRRTACKHAEPSPTCSAAAERLTEHAAQVHDLLVRRRTERPAGDPYTTDPWRPGREPTSAQLVDTQEREATERAPPIR